jgi:hypothetical protein
MAFNFSRYTGREVLKNGSAQYAEQLASRSLSFIRHFVTPAIGYPSNEILAKLDIENEIWGVGSRFYKIAAKHYGDPSLWWIIPWFNKLPLETDYEAGEVVLIPKPLHVVLGFFE